MNNSIKLTLFGLILYIMLSFIKKKNKTKNSEIKIKTPTKINEKKINTPPPIVGVALGPEKIVTDAFTKAVEAISHALPKATHQMLADRYTPPKKSHSYLSGAYSRNHY
jgi:hypothetical protein